MDDGIVSESDLSGLLKTRLTIEHLEVQDVSGGCGAKFELVVISPDFEGKGLLDRHRMVNDALKELLPKIHALSMKTWTPTQWESKKK